MKLNNILILFTFIKLVLNTDQENSISSSNVSNKFYSEENFTFGDSGKLIVELEDNNKCKIFRAQTFYNKIGFHLKNFKNIDNVLITDTVPIDCNTCDPKSEICQTAKINNNDISNNQYVNFFWKLCLNNILIVVNPINNSNNNNNNSNSNSNLSTQTNYSSFDLDSNFFNNSPCISNHETHLSYCAESNLEDCRKCKRFGCSIVECGNYSNNKFIHHFDLCLINNLTEEEKETICQEFDGVNSHNHNSKYKCNFDDLEGYSFLTVFIIFILSVAVIVFSVMVVYYNVYLIRHSQPPFEPPSYFPIFLFPRESEDSKKTGDNLNKVFKTSDYDNN